MSKLKEQIEQLKKERFEEIKADTTLTKREKLAAFFEENLIPVRGWIGHPFEKYTKQLYEQEKARGKTCIIIDDFFRRNCEYRSRGETISYSSLAESIEEGAEFQERNEVIIAESRGDYDYSTSPPTKIVPATLSISVEEAIDHLYNYAIENNECGFVYDW